MLREVTPRRLLGALRNHKIVDLHRRAKHIVMLLDSDLRIVIQLRMSGTLLLARGKPDQDEQRYRVLQAEIGRGTRLVYRDVRRLGTINLLDEKAWNAYTERLGPEPLSEEFDPDQFSKRLRGTKVAIKKALMDQRRVVGVGNIYANEALYRARIDPSLRTDKLNRSAKHRLYEEVRAVLNEAIDARGTTLKDYRTGTGERGSFQGILQVYGRGGEPCLACGSTLATTHAIDGRATTFCWRCQGIKR